MTSARGVPVPLLLAAAAFAVTIGVTLAGGGEIARYAGAGTNLLLAVWAAIATRGAPRAVRWALPAAFGLLAGARFLMPDNRELQPTLRGITRESWR